MLNLTATKPQLKVVFDQCGTPTYALDLANAIQHILATIATSETPVTYCGIYHFSNEGVCSWYDFTQMIYRISNNLTAQSSKLTAQCDIQSCHSDEFPSKVNRPAYSVLDKTKIKETFGIKIPYWTDSLKVCLERMNK